MVLGGDTHQQIFMLLYQKQYGYCKRLIEISSGANSVSCCGVDALAFQSRVQCIKAEKITFYEFSVISKLTVL
jgi:hypothetical protein